MRIGNFTHTVGQTIRLPQVVKNIVLLNNIKSFVRPIYVAVIFSQPNIPKIKASKQMTYIISDEGTSIISAVHSKSERLPWVILPAISNE